MENIFLHTKFMRKNESWDAKDGYMHSVFRGRDQLDSEKPDDDLPHVDGERCTQHHVK